MRQQQNRLRDVANRPLGETRLVFVDERDDVSAGDVAEVDDRETVGVEVESDGRDLAGGDGRSDGARVQEVGEREIVEVFRGAGDFRAPSLRRTLRPTASSREAWRRLYGRGRQAVFRSDGVPIIAATPASSVAIGLPSM